MLIAGRPIVHGAKTFERGDDASFVADFPPYIREAQLRSGMVLDVTAEQAARIRAEVAEARSQVEAQREAEETQRLETLRKTLTEELDRLRLEVEGKAAALADLEERLVASQTTDAPNGETTVAAVADHVEGLPVDARSPDAPPVGLPSQPHQPDDDRQAAGIEVIEPDDDKPAADAEAVKPDDAERPTKRARKTRARATRGAARVAGRE